MYRQIYKLYHAIFAKFANYYKNIIKSLEFGHTNSGMNNYPIFGSKFGLTFSDPRKLEDLYSGKIGSSNCKKIKAYYYEFDLELSVGQLEYVELICNKTGTNLTNINLPKMGCDIMKNKEPYINILKMKLVVEQYLIFYKKQMDEAKKNISKDSINDKITYV